VNYQKRHENQLNYWFRVNKWYLLGALVFMLVLGLVGHIEFNQERLEQAQWTCEHQLYETTPTYQQCISNQLEVNSDK
jgi:hypothetical protein